MSTKEEEGIQLLLHCDGRWDAKSRGWKVSRGLIVNNGNDGVPVVVAWRRRWDAKSEEGSVADWVMATKEEEGIQLLLHCDGRWDAKSEEGGVADGHSNGNAVQRIVNKKRCRCFMLCTAATYKSRKKVEMGAAVAIVIFKE